MALDRPDPLRFVPGVADPDEEFKRPPDEGGLL